jgi:transcriptional regulator with XRE-family HTH domain
MDAIIMSKDRVSTATPIPVIRSLRKLGQDIRDARKRRRIPVAILAERASISRTTLSKLEKGDSGVSIGIFATILFVLGMIDRLSDLADPMHDAVGRELEDEHLPKRIRLSKRQSGQTKNSRIR